MGYDQFLEIEQNGVFKEKIWGIGDMYDGIRIIFVA